MFEQWVKYSGENCVFNRGNKSISISCCPCAWDLRVYELWPQYESAKLLIRAWEKSKCWIFCVYVWREHWETDGVAEQKDIEVWEWNCKNWRYVLVQSHKAQQKKKEKTQPHTHTHTHHTDWLAKNTCIHTFIWTSGGCFQMDLPVPYFVIVKFFANTTNHKKNSSEWIEFIW